MLKWLRDRNGSQRVGVIESVQLDGKRSIKLVRRDNIEHLVLVGGRNDLMIEPNIVRRPAPKPAHRPAPEMSALPPPGVPTREPLAGSPPKSRQHDLGELTRRLEAELRDSPPLRPYSPPPRTEAESLAQSEANMQVEPDGEEAVPNDGTEKNPVR
jgi:flagellar protein FliO/FliZ